MHFRVRASGIQLVRAGRDEAGKATNKVLGTVPKSTLELREAVARNLTAEERGAFDAFVARYRNTQGLKQRLAAHEFPDTVAAVVEYYDQLADGEEKDAIRGHIAEALTYLRRATR